MVEGRSHDRSLIDSVPTAIEVGQGSAVALMALAITASASEASPLAARSAAVLRSAPAWNRASSRARSSSKAEIEGLLELERPMTGEEHQAGVGLGHRRPVRPVGPDRCQPLQHGLLRLAAGTCVTD